MSASVKLDHFDHFEYILDYINDLSVVSNVPDKIRKKSLHLLKLCVTCTKEWLIPNQARKVLSMNFPENNNKTPQCLELDLIK
jgi:hypothetical protein